MDQNNKEARSPGYYVRQRLLRNYPAMAGLIIICCSVFIAFFSYLLMPDPTPDANDGAVQIQKQPPGYSATFLKIRKNITIPHRSFFGKLFYGQESEFILVPITGYSIDGMKVTANLYGKKNYQKTYNLLNCVKAINVIDENFREPDPPAIEPGMVIRYPGLSGKEEAITYQQLVEEFENTSIEKRSFILGTDKSGRDLFSRLIFGTRISLSIGFIAVLISMFLGISLGSLGGFFGGKIDSFIMWFMSVVWSIPGIILVIAISMALQSRGVWVAFVAVGLTMWVDVARVVRGQIMAVKEKLFIEAARAFGIKNFRIVFVHILPNIAGSLIVIATANFAAAIMLEAGLGFLGLSVQPPTPSWGVMIFEGFQAIGTKNSAHLILFPGMAICCMVLAFNMLGNGLRDAFDPKTMLK